MKIIRNILFIALALAVLPAAAQVENVVKWTNSVNDNGDGKYTLVLTADINDGWHIYDLQNYEGGPNPTTIRFVAGEGAELDGAMRQLSSPVKIYDDIFGMEIGYFEKKAVFEQDVRLSAQSATVKAEVEYMACNDQNCIPPTEEEITLSERDRHPLPIPPVPYLRLRRTQQAAAACGRSS